MSLLNGQAEYISTELIQCYTFEHNATMQKIYIPVDSGSIIKRLKNEIKLIKKNMKRRYTK